jgi:polyphosphate kinase
MKGSGGNGAILAKAMKDLRTHWEATERTWRDQARSDFDREIIQEIVPLAIQASNAMQQIEELLRQIKREVG